MEADTVGLGLVLAGLHGEEREAVALFVVISVC